MTESQRTPGIAFQTGVQHTTSGVVRAVCVVVIPVEHRREVNAQLVVADPANVIKQIVISRETETGAAIEAITFVTIFTVVASHILELRTNTAANGEVKTAQRITRLWILFQNSDFRLRCERR